MKIFGGKKGNKGGHISLIVVANFTETIATALEKRAGDVVTKTVFDLEAEIKNALSKPGGGIMYGGHRASNPGEPPATDIGDLVGSVHGEMIDKLHGYVEVTSDHGLYLEYGTVNMAARPFFSPSVDKVLPGYNQAMGMLFHV